VEESVNFKDENTRAETEGWDEEDEEKENYDDEIVDKVGGKDEDSDYENLSELLEDYENSKSIQELKREERKVDEEDDFNYDDWIESGNVGKESEIVPEKVEVKDEYPPALGEKEKSGYYNPDIYERFSFKKDPKKDKKEFTQVNLKRNFTNFGGSSEQLTSEKKFKYS
jgi:hypothetical protein